MMPGSGYEAASRVAVLLADFPLCGGADEAWQAWRIDQRSSFPRIESPGAAAPTTNFCSVSVWVWKRVGSSAELNTFLLLVSPLQCRRHGGEYLAGTASVLYRSAEALKSAEPTTGSELDGVLSPPVEAGVGDGGSARFADFPFHVLHAAMDLSS